MTPEQVVALLQLIADLRIQLGLLANENAQLSAENDKLKAASEPVDFVDYSTPDQPTNE